MSDHSTRYRRISQFFWVLTLLAIAIWSQVPHYVVGWDLEIYRNAIRSMQAGHDPYLDGIAIQDQFHRTLSLHPNDPPPYTYVYSPITLPVLALIGRLPQWLSSGLYWLAIALAAVTAISVCYQVGVAKKERRIFALVAPAVVFFPGLLQQDVLFSGNVAYIVYGLALGTAYWGWRYGQWRWFYLAVLAASCTKAPFLTMLAVPLLSARRQWIPTVVTGAAGLGLFALQPVLWPDRFHHYLQAVELQFSYNHDFSSSPAGLLADLLYYKIPYQVTSAVFYALYALAIFSVLFYFSRKYLTGQLTQAEWIPPMMIGVILLNPRIMEYDVAPITLMMALVAWRFFSLTGSLPRAIVGVSVLFALTNAVAALPYSMHTWRPTECFLLVFLFFAGCWTLNVELRDRSTASAEPVPSGRSQ